MEKGALTENETQFINSLNKGTPDEIKRYLNCADIRTDCLDETGMTPLCHAAYRGRSEIVSLLILRGANPNSKEHKSGYTPLMFAVMSGSVETVHTLMAAGADPDVENNTRRTAAQLAGFISQHECAIVINSYVKRQEIDYHTVPRGFDSTPKLPPRLAAPLHRYLLNTNLNLFWLAKELIYNPDAHQLIDNGNHVHVVRVIDALIEKECKSQELNEMRAMKVHYLGSILQVVVSETSKLKMEKNDGSEKSKDLPEWLRNLVRPSVQDQFAKKTIGNFPHHDLALLRQLMHQVKTSPPQARFSTAMSSLLISIGGRMYDRLSAADACGTCGARDAQKQCANCHDVVYCNAECQRIHWPVHKKICRDQGKEKNTESIKEPPNHPYAKYAGGQCPFSSPTSAKPPEDSADTGSVKPICPVSGKSSHSDESPPHQI